MTPLRSILLVDDHLYIRRMLSETLTLARYDVIPVSTAQDAFAAFRTLRIDLVLTDLNLAGPSGHALASAIRRTGGRGAHLPILGMTADPFVQIGLHREKTGLSAIIAKPFDLATFIATVDRICAERPAPPPPSDYERQAFETACADRASPCFRTRPWRER